MRERQSTIIRQRLDNVGKMRKRISALYERLENMEARLSSPSSPSWEKIGSGGTPNHDRLAERIGEKIDLEAKIRGIEVELQKERGALSALFEKLEPNQELVCCLRYVDGLSWRDTIAAMYDSRDDYEENEDAYANRAFKAHGRALAELDRLTAEEE